MHVAVTGASSGIGEAIAREFARAGASLTLVARRENVLRTIASELGVKTFVVAQDLTDSAHAADWLDAAEAALGPIDILISNAGLLTLGPLASFDPAQGERMFAINLLTPARLMRAIVPRMLARGSGVLVNVTSMAAVVGLPDWVYQSASKAGSASFSETLHLELRGSGVHVMTVYPGMTDTPMTRSGVAAYGPSKLVKLIPFGSSATLARRLRHAIARRRPRLFYPRFYALTRHFPRIAQWLAARFTPRLPPRPA